MNDDMMRRLLHRKLEDPNWQALQEERYRQIMGAEPIAASRDRSALSPAESVVIGALPADIDSDEIEYLWLGNWQRADGLIAVTRYPDDTVALDLPDGGRTVYSPQDQSGGTFCWSAETVDGYGRTTNVYRPSDEFRTARLALVDMHRNALEAYLALLDADES